MELLELPTESTLQQSNLSVTEQDMIDLFKRFITLQDQFNQLTIYVEKAFERITQLEKTLHSKVLS